MVFTAKLRPRLLLVFTVATLVLFQVFSIFHFALLDLARGQVGTQHEEDGAAIMSMSSPSRDQIEPSTVSIVQTEKLSRADNNSDISNAGIAAVHVQSHKRQEELEQEDYQTAFARSTKPDPNVPTLAYFQTAFYSGFRNQGMVFTGFVMEAVAKNFTQILLPTIRWKDLFGTNRPVAHERLFDVVHWNSFNATLPRFVTYDQVAHEHYNVNTSRWNIDNPEANATLPFAYGRYPRMMNKYKQYTKRLLNSRGAPELSPVDLIMMQGTFTPHPDLQKHIDGLHGSIAEEDDEQADGGVSSYMALHARVEPDMQKHPVCRNMKVIKLQTIFDSLQLEFPEAPTTRLFIAINRPMLEKEVADPDRDNEIAAENLAVLNRAFEQGLWDGKVAVFEAGIPSLNHTAFKAHPGISGSVVDYFLAIGAKVFVGTPVSSFTTDLVAARFYRGNTENYHYLPSGVKRATMANTTVPPRFRC